jgi:uncharacterized protein (DUF2235 family)
MAGKNIILCLDGTGNEYGKNITNVVETYILSQKTDNQIVYYDPGIGTGGYLYDENTGKLRAAYDKATGTGVHKNVEQAYLYLMEKYRAGDRVYIFGFSRGAFSARSLAGMLYKIGLLPNEHDNQLEYASKYYMDKKYHNIIADYRENFCRPCPVHFVGVWDTVDSTILTEGAKFSDAKLNPEVKYAYHAISIDERRKDFPIKLWDEKNLSPGQTMEQVWFAGVHSNVGGWYENRDLSSIALVWMIEKAKAAGLKIDANKFAKIKAQQNPVGKIHESYEKFWKFRGDRPRKIPIKAHVHQSVSTRKNSVAAYNPKIPPSHIVV